MLVSNHKKYDIAIIGAGPVGVFLAHLLTKYGVSNCLIERRLSPTSHPQAHFLNARTMELLQSCYHKAFQELKFFVPPSSEWRNFVYCYNVLGREFCRIDHFHISRTPSSFWMSSPTTICHLPQNVFESVIQKNLEIRDFYRGYEVSKVDFSNILDKSSQTIFYIKPRDESVEPNCFTEISCKYVVAADGAHSTIRDGLRISLQGKSGIQTLLNIHFLCAGLSKLVRTTNPAMLYFTFNEDSVAVLVAHNLARDEWVCQLPIFPPFQRPEDFREENLVGLISGALGLNSTESPGISESSIRILSRKVWSMNALVADTFVKGRAFLVGDSAHQFPPAGGFGLNTGLQDAHNLAWKLALVVSGHAHPDLLYTYHTERHSIATANCEFSLRNYQTTVETARTLGADPTLARTLVQSAASAPITYLLPETLRRSAVTSALRLGLAPLRLLRDSDSSGGGIGDLAVGRLRRLLLGDGKGQGGAGLRLIFPVEDLQFKYKRGAVLRVQESGHSLAPAVDPKPFADNALLHGARVAHCWLASRLDESSGGIMDRQVCSTVYLPAMLARLVGTRFGGVHPVPVTLLVAQDEAGVWATEVCAAMDDMFPTGVAQSSGGCPAVVLVSISMTALPSDGAHKPRGSGEAHKYLQRLFQSPGHAPLHEGDHHPSPWNPGPLSAIFADTPDNEAMERRRLAELFGVSWRGRSQAVPCMEVEDISGRWRELLWNTVSHRGDGSGGQWGGERGGDHFMSEERVIQRVRRVAVALRPDGHVIGWLDGDGGSASCPTKFHFLRSIFGVLRLR